MYMKPSRTGGLYAAAPFGWSAQPIVSSSGSASATPSPRRQVRRLISRSLRMGCLFRLFRVADPAVGERIAGHDADDERLHAVVVFRDDLGQSVDDDLVVAFQ